LRNSRKTPPCNRRFFDFIIGKRHYRFYNIREYTDIADDKYILLAYCADSLMYISRKYSKLKNSLKKFDIREKSTPTKIVSGIPFSITPIFKNGYSIYLGYEISIIYLLKRRILNIFLMIFPVGIVLSIGCGYLATRSSLKIIKTITKTANRISSKNLSERIIVPSEKDEISELVVTLNSMIDRLEKSFTMVQQFSQDAAHEIRTPLTIVRGEIEELLKDERCPEYISNILDNVLEEIQYLTSTSNKLLLIHGFDTDKIKYHFTSVNLNKILEEIFQDAEVLSTEKKLNIKLDIKDLIQVQGNEELLVRLFWNIIDNAIKYNKKNGSVVITLERKENNAVVCIRDTGIGIPEEEIPRIFDRFYRVDKSRSRELGGSGLGLSICKWIVELHKGEIKVESQLSIGSKFTVFLPVFF